MTDYIKAWQCIGCGRLEAPQPCLGICQDRKVRLVDAVEHEAVLAQLAYAAQRMLRFEAVLRQLAFTTPRAGAWEKSYLTIQVRARRALQAQTEVPPSLLSLNPTADALWISTPVPISTRTPDPHPQSD